MAKNFGTTWWGNRWLQSLTHIDYENRIPRGATYARSGAVSEVKVTGNIKGKGPRKAYQTIFGDTYYTAILS